MNKAKTHDIYREGAGVITIPCAGEKCWICIQKEANAKRKRNPNKNAGV